MPNNHDLRYLDLRDSGRMPTLGLGTWKIGERDTAEVVRKALQVGWRHLDCACDYGNETEVGAGVAQTLAGGVCRRDELWMTSKLWNTYHRPEHVRLACERSLRDLGLDYLDLYLMHFPIALEFVPFERRYPPGWLDEPEAEEPAMKPVRVPLSETWAAMEVLVDAGLVRSIGVCNFGTSLLRDLLSHARIPPAVLQVELHPFLAQERLLRFCVDQDIAVTAFSPFGSLSYSSQEENVLETAEVRAAAERHGRTPAQVVLRFGIQRGTAVIPKTSQSHRLVENLDLFSFSLSEEEMGDISGLDRHRRFNDPGDFCETAFGTFFPIYE
jgi:diketogulonate reductase-like aldo/keto reductase